MRLDTLGSIGYTLLSCNEGGGGVPPEQIFESGRD